MKSLFWLLAVFAAAVALVLLARVDSGHVLFFYPPWRVEMSMVFFVAAALASFLVLYLLMRMLGNAFALPATVRAWRARRRRERSHIALAAALQAYYEGRYARAEQEAGFAADNGPSPGVAALLAARAAHQMRDFDKRDRWLDRADAAGEALQAARLVSRAELALEERDFAGARDALRSLHGAGPKHIATTRMLLRAERGAGANARTSPSPPRCRPTTKDAMRAPSRKPASPPTTAPRPASPRCSRRAPRTRCATSTSATAGSIAPAPPARRCRRRAW